MSDKFNNLIKIDDFKILDFTRREEIEANEPYYGHVLYNGNISADNRHFLSKTCRGKNIFDIMLFVCGSRLF